MNQNIVAARTVTTMKAAIAHFLKCIVWLFVWEVGGTAEKLFVRNGRKLMAVMCCLFVLC
jgi:hypothetical protein